MLFQIGYYGGGFFENVIYTMQQYGVIDVLLPFALIFGIIYAVLDKWGPFKGAENKKINALIGISIALLAIVPHVTGQGPDIVAMLNQALPEIGLLVVAIVLLMVVTGLAGKPDKPNWINSAAPWIALGLLLIIFLRALFPQYMWGQLFYWMNAPFIDFIVALLIMTVIVWLIVGKSGGK